MPPKKRITNNKGSTLLVVVVFIALLTMMGAALLVSTAAHLKAQKVQEDRKFAFYSAEAGIDEVIARLSEQVQKIHGEATEEVHSEMDDELKDHMIQYERWLAFKRANDEDIPDVTDINDDAPGLPSLYTVEGTINQDEAYKLAEEKYREAFTTRFKDYVKANIMCVDKATASELEAEWNTQAALPANTAKIEWGNSLDLSKEKRYETAPEDITVKVGIQASTSDIEFVDKDPDADKEAFELDLPIFSIYNPKDAARKLITVNVTVKVPDYDMPIIVAQNVMKFEPNILWTKALTADKDIIVNSSPTAPSTVYGNIYAGENITVGKDNGAKITLNGEAVASGDIKFGKSNSTFEINGNAYAENIIVGAHEEENPDTSNSIISTIKNCTLNIKKTTGTAYTSQSIGGLTVSDLKGKLSIGDAVTLGNLELLGSGSKVSIAGHYTGTSTPDTLSSRIIIDTPELEPESPESLVALGTELTISGETTICGSAYLKFPTGSVDERFNTGESVAIRNNFMGYANWLVGSFLTTFENSFKSNHFPNVPASNSLLYHNVSGIFAPLSFGGIPLDILDKADYFYQIGMMEDSVNLGDTGMTPYINKGSGLIKLNGDYYGYGTGISNGNMLSRKPDNLIAERQSNAETMFYRQVNAFGDLEINGDDLEYYITSGSQSLFSDLFKIDGTYSYSSDNRLNGYREIVEAKSGTVTLNEEYIKGVIIATGDVTIASTVKEFRGTIIAGGDIIIEGNTTIINDRDFIAKALACYNDNGVLRSDNKGFTIPEDKKILPTYTLFTPKDTIYVTKEDYTYVHDKDVDISNKYNTINTLVSTLDWSVIEY